MVIPKNERITGFAVSAVALVLVLVFRAAWVAPLVVALLTATWIAIALRPRFEEEPVVELVVSNSVQADEQSVRDAMEDVRSAIVDELAPAPRSARVRASTPPASSASSGG